MVVWDRGIFLPAQSLWLDPPGARDLAFVSHAHTDHVRRHRLALLTADTLALLPARRRPHEVRILEFGLPAAVGSATLTPLPSGHILGAAQLLVEHEERLLYTGDLRLRQPDRPPTAVPRADVLIIESTYGRPHFRFPDPAEVTEQMATWCRRALEGGVTPVLVAGALGKAQEVLRALAPHDFEFALDHACVAPTLAHRAAGLELPDFVELADGEISGRVVIMAPTGGTPRGPLGRYRSALISGWALEPSVWRRFGVDTAFPLSDHCDFDDLLAVVAAVAPRQVHTVHGFTEDLSRHLRRRGVPASPLRLSQQLELSFS